MCVCVCVCMRVCECVGVPMQVAPAVNLHDYGDHLIH